MTPSGACKPSEVFFALFDDQLPVRFIRVEQGRMQPDGTLITPMDLAHLEQIRPEPKRKEAPAPVVDATEAAPTGG